MFLGPHIEGKMALLDAVLRRRHSRATTYVVKYEYIFLFYGLINYIFAKTPILINSIFWEEHWPCVWDPCTNRPFDFDPYNLEACHTFVHSEFFEALKWFFKFAFERFQVWKYFFIKWGKSFKNVQIKHYNSTTYCRCNRK